MDVLALLAFAAAAPVWIASQSSGGLMVSWDKGQAQQSIHLVIRTPAGEKRYPLERPAGAMIVSTPAAPFRLGYIAGDGELTVLTQSGVLPEPIRKPVPVRLPFQTGAEQALLLAPIPPSHLKQALRRGRTEVDLFIKVSPGGKVASTSSPYYPDSTRRELASVASDTALQEWRFKPAKYPAYRDGRVRLSFNSAGARIRAYGN